MAHTNQTPNYELSQFLGTDKPAWLVDYNGDMEKIDLGLKAAKDVADSAKEEADQGAIDIAAVTVTANSADAKASGAVSDISDAYDATSTYDLGDLVIYNNLLYKCTTAITVPETFDGTHWTRITIEELIDTINSNLSDLTRVESLTESYTVDANSTVTINFTIPSKVGFKPIALQRVYSGMSLVQPYEWAISSNTSASIQARNISNSTQNSNATIVVLYIKD